MWSTNRKLSGRNVTTMAYKQKTCKGEEVEIKKNQDFNTQKQTNANISMLGIP